MAKANNHQLIEHLDAIQQELCILHACLLAAECMCEQNGSEEMQILARALAAQVLRVWEQVKKLQ